MYLRMACFACPLLWWWGALRCHDAGATMQQHQHRLCQWQLCQTCQTTKLRILSLNSLDSAFWKISENFLKFFFLKLSRKIAKTVSKKILKNFPRNFQNVSKKNSKRNKFPKNQSKVAQTKLLVKQRPPAALEPQDPPPPPVGPNLSHYRVTGLAVGCFPLSRHKYDGKECMLRVVTTCAIKQEGPQ